MGLIKILKIGPGIWEPAEAWVERVFDNDGKPVLTPQGTQQVYSRDLQVGDVIGWGDSTALEQAGVVVRVDEQGNEIDPISNEIEFEDEKGQKKKLALTSTFEALDKKFKKKAGVNKRVHANEDQLRELKRLWNEYAEAEVEKAISQLTNAATLRLIARSEGVISTKKRWQWIREMAELFMRNTREEIRKTTYTEVELKLESLKDSA